MIIKSFIVREISSTKEKQIDFVDAINLVFSENNSTGKTTFIRSMLFALGFQIPSTELIDFNDYEFSLEIEQDNKSKILFRKENYFRIDEQEFDLPVEQKNAQSIIFGIENNELLDNFLGVHYFDQEKGWTLLNRGIIIGKNRFGIESYFRGLKNDESQESYELDAQLKATQNKLSQYRLMLKIADYQESVRSDFDSEFDYYTFNQEQETKLMGLKMELQKVNNEISIIDSIIKENNSFSKYIESKSIYVVSPDGGEPFRVTKDLLFNFDESSEMNQTRKKCLPQNVTQ